MSNSDNRDHFIIDYLRNNFTRLLELAVIVIAVFITMQKNIESQGKILDRLVEQQDEQQQVLSSLTVVVAKLSVNVENIRSSTDRCREDLDKLEDDHRGEH